MNGRTPTPRQYRIRARDALFYSSNWIAALISTFAVMLIVFTAVYLTECIDAFTAMISAHPLPIRPIAAVLWYLMLSPLCYGLLGYYTDLCRAAQGEGPVRVPTAVIFSAYASKTSVVRAWAFMFIALSLQLLLPLSLVPLHPLLSGSVSGIGMLQLLPAVSLCVLLLSFALYLGARLMPSLFLGLSRPELPISAILRRTLRQTGQSAGCAVLLQLGLLVSAVLTLLFTAGIGFFLYVLPNGICTYICFCQDLARRTDLSVN